MANPWFRLYSEFATDPKVQMLSETDQRRYIMLLCIRCSNENVTLQDSEVTFCLRITPQEWSITKANLLAKNLITEGNNPTSWDKRQFTSDSSAERVARHRKKVKQQCNVTVTPPEQNRTEQIQNTKAAPDGFERFWKSWPVTDRKQAKGKCLAAWKKASAERDAAVILAHVEFLKSTESWRKDGGQFIPSPLVYLNQRRWEGAETIGEAADMRSRFRQTNGRWEQNDPVHGWFPVSETEVPENLRGAA